MDLLCIVDSLRPVVAATAPAGAALSTARRVFVGLSPPGCGCGGGGGGRATGEMTSAVRAPALYRARAAASAAAVLAATIPCDRGDDADATADARGRVTLATQSASLVKFTTYWGPRRSAAAVGCGRVWQ